MESTVKSFDSFINPNCYTSNAATMAKCLGIEPPESAKPALDWLAEQLLAKLGGTAERSLFFHPDAVAQWLWRKYPEMLTAVMTYAPMAMPYCAVMPSVTPVCFASIYSGAYPEVHGIREYRKPILTVDTLFDSMIRAGKRVANIASADSSMSIIFSNRKMENIVLKDDAEVCEKALELLESDKYDHISVYCGEYDSYMHHYSTEAPEALAKLREHNEYFGKIASKASKLWEGKRALITFQTDHGVHDTPINHGAHGIESTDDMNIVHFFGVL